MYNVNLHDMECKPAKQSKLGKAARVDEDAPRSISVNGADDPKSHNMNGVDAPKSHNINGADTPKSPNVNGMDAVMIVLAV